jgi:hypothetical protein
MLDARTELHGTRYGNVRAALHDLPSPGGGTAPRLVVFAGLHSGHAPDATRAEAPPILGEVDSLISQQCRLSGDVPYPVRVQALLLSKG